MITCDPTHLQNSGRLSCVVIRLSRSKKSAIGKLAVLCEGHNEPEKSEWANGHFQYRQRSDIQAPLEQLRLAYNRRKESLLLFCWLQNLQNTAPECHGTNLAESKAN